MGTSESVVRCPHKDACVSCYALLLGGIAYAFLCILFPQFLFVYLAHAGLGYGFYDLIEVRGPSFCFVPAASFRRVSRRSLSSLFSSISSALVLCLSPMEPLIPVKATNQYSTSSFCREGHGYYYIDDRHVWSESADRKKEKHNQGGEPFLPPDCVGHGLILL